MDVPTQDELIGSIDAFFGRHPAIGEARFGRDATGEPGLVGALRRGRSPTMRIAEKIADFMARKDAELDHAGADTNAVAAASPGNGHQITGAET